MRINKNKGQVALVVLIISAIIMTIGLSVSKKSVLETKITTDEESLKQAFNAAESGIDYYLGTGITSFTSTDKSQAEVRTSSIGGGRASVNLDKLILRNNDSYTWFIGHRDDGSLDPGSNMNGLSSVSVCVDNAFNGALKVDYFYMSGGNYNVLRGGYNVGNVPVSGFTNNAFSGGCSAGGMKSISFNVPPATTPLLLVVKPINDDTHIVVDATGGGNFPSQGVQISSTGTAAQVSRKINIINQYQIPDFMLDAVTATGNVLSN